MSIYPRPSTNRTYLRKYQRDVKRQERIANSDYKLIEDTRKAKAEAKRKRKKNRNAL